MPGTFWSREDSTPDTWAEYSIQGSALRWPLSMRERMRALTALEPWEDQTNSKRPPCPTKTQDRDHAGHLDKSYYEKAE